MQYEYTILNICDSRVQQWKSC